jgi:GNAT superfamily N-acetyltransferase
MPEPLPAVSLRPALAEDAEFVFRVTEFCMRRYAEQTWGRWDEAYNRASFAPETHQIVQYDSQDIGCIEVEDAPTHMRVNKLYILPAYQNRGIGAQLMRQLILRAANAGKPIRLSVLLVNPARRFYERLGFSVRESTSERHFMEWCPDNQVAK